MGLATPISEKERKINVVFLKKERTLKFLGSRPMITQS
jgi:hypothetical protein